MRCFARTEGSSICQKHWLRVAKNLPRHLMLFVSFWQVRYYDEWISSLQLDLNILGRILQEKCIFMQSGNFTYLSSGKPTMKSAIGYFRWLQSFPLGTGSNLYIISRRRLGLVRVWRRYSDFKPWPPLLQIFLTASKNSASWNHRSGVISVTQNVKLYFNL